MSEKASVKIFHIFKVNYAQCAQLEKLVIRELVQLIMAYEPNQIYNRLYEF